MKKIRYSVSRIQLYKDCKRKYNYRYITKVKTKINLIHLEKGRVFHSFFENYPDLPKNKNPGVYEPIFELFVNTLKRNEDIVRLLESPHVSEHSLKHEWLRGFIDYLAINGEYAIILDWKSGKYYPDKTFFQLELYAYYLFSIIEDLQEISLIFYYVEVDKQDIKVVRREDFYKKFEEKLLKLINKIETTENWPKDPERKWCQWCEFSEICNPNTCININGDQMIKTYLVKALNGKEAKIAQNFGAAMSFNHGTKISLDEKFASQHKEIFLPVKEVKPKKIIKAKKTKEKSLNESVKQTISEGQESLNEIMPKPDVGKAITEEKFEKFEKNDEKKENDQPETKD